MNGTISGSNVTLHLSNGVTWVGTLSSFGLVTRYESPSGALLGVRFRPASDADYTAAVAKTKATVDRQKYRLPPSMLGL